MYAIRARYHGPTDTLGSRHVVTWGDRRATVPYDHAASRADDAAILRALRSRRFVGPLAAWAGDLEPRWIAGTLREGGRDGDRVAVVVLVDRAMRDKPGEPFPAADLP